MRTPVCPPPVQPKGEMLLKLHEEEDAILESTSLKKIASFQIEMC